MNIVFVCHGNICRSVMAEFICKKISGDLNLKNINCSSFAVSNEEIGNDIYYNAKKTLDNHHIHYEKHYARKITYQDCVNADYIFIMDSSNYKRIKEIAMDQMFKVSYLNNEIEDPWYTNNFEKVYQEIEEGILIFLKNIEVKND